MASQTTRIESNGRSPRGVFGNAAELIHDLLELSELQVQLLKLDLKQGSQHMLVPLGLIVFGGCLALGCFPIFLGALAMGLTQAGLSSWLALLIAGAIGVLVSGATAYGGFLLLKKQASIMHRSQEEFGRNLEWVKTALTRKPRPAEYRTPK